LAEWSGALAVAADALLLLECIKWTRSDTSGPIEFGSGILRDANGAAEWLALRGVGWGGAIERVATVAVDSGSLPEWVGRGVAGTGFRVEGLRVLIGDEGVPLKLLAVLSCDALTIFESLTSGSRISVVELLTLEWADPPALLLVSPERLLRSPGRIRILAGPGSTHPLRGQ
jgi:hypothetical protein